MPAVDSLRGPILRSVSRSFYLSVRILPKRMRDPVALGYLLARASDTIADTTDAPAESRAQKLEALAKAIQDESARETIVDLVSSFAPLQKDNSERALIEKLPEMFAWLNQIDPTDRADVQAVLEKINRGQRNDLELFRDPKQIVALEKSDDLDEYTYLVAGAAGEFWTRLGFRHLQKFARRDENEMLDLGKRYGMGLQLINILRDAGNDLRAGRCYFPNEELAAARMEPAQVLREPQRFFPIYRKWLKKAEHGIEAGIEYADAVRNRRVRFATALPALIGARTIALLRDAGATVLQRKIKVPRNEVRSMITRLAMSFASQTQIERMFRELGRGDLPQSPRRFGESLLSHKK
jgi:farnesyl-diphosphate farnesyltransferase